MAGPCTPCDRDDGSMKFERRCEPRHGANGRVMATFRDAEDRPRLMPVELVDRSDGGLGVRCPVRVPEGESVSLFESGTYSMLGVGASVRSEADSDGWHRVGLFLGERCRAA